MALHPELRANLAKASSESKAVPKELHGKNKKVLQKLADEVPSDLKFDAVWAVDAYGRVVGAVDDVTGANAEEWSWADTRSSPTRCTAGSATTRGS